jgi:hypothetical protein
VENNQQKNSEFHSPASNEDQGQANDRMTEQIIDQPQHKSSNSILSDAGRLGFIMLICALMIGIYHVSFNSKPQKLATVNLKDIYSAKEKQFAALITKKGATDADRAAAYELVKAFGPQLQKSINDVQQDCNCIVISRQAILAGNVEDKTAELKVKLGMK